MIAAITALLLCQCCGEVLVRALALPLPGPVAGLGLLFCLLVLRGWWHGRSGDDAVPPQLLFVSDGLLRNLSLLFIPASVGVVQHLALLRTFAVPIALIIAGSTTTALVVTALTFRFVARLHAFRHKPVLAQVSAALDEADHP